MWLFVIMLSASNMVDLSPNCQPANWFKWFLRLCINQAFLSPLQPSSQEHLQGSQAQTCLLPPCCDILRVWQQSRQIISSRSFVRSRMSIPRLDSPRIWNSLQIVRELKQRIETRRQSYNRQPGTRRRVSRLLSRFWRILHSQTTQSTRNWMSSQLAWWASTGICKRSSMGWSCRATLDNGHTIFLGTYRSTRPLLTPSCWTRWRLQSHWLRFQNSQQLVVVAAHSGAADPEVFHKGFLLSTAEAEDFAVEVLDRDSPSSLISMRLRQTEWMNRFSDLCPWIDIWRPGVALEHPPLCCGGFRRVCLCVFKRGHHTKVSRKIEFTTQRRSSLFPVNFSIWLSVVFWLQWILNRIVSFPCKLRQRPQAGSALLQTVDMSIVTWRCLNFLRVVSRKWWKISKQVTNWLL